MEWVFLALVVVINVWSAWTVWRLPGRAAVLRTAIIATMALVLAAGATITDASSWALASILAVAVVWLVTLAAVGSRSVNERTGVVRSSG